MAEPEQTLVTIESQFEEVQDFLLGDDMQTALKLAVPDHLDPLRLARLAYTLVKSKPKLLACSRVSLYGAVLESAQLGLEIGTVGHCWLVPYKGEVALRVGYQGLCALAWRSEQIMSIDARVVCENDEFGYRFGTDKFLHHVKGPSGSRGKFTHAYAIVETTTKGVMFDVMDEEEVFAIRDRSPAYNYKSGPWITDPASMWKKTPIRQILKTAPCSIELRRAIKIDTDADLGKTQGLANNMIDVTPISGDDIPVSPTPTDETEEK